MASESLVNVQIYDAIYGVVNVTKRSTNTQIYGRHIWRPYKNPKGKEDNMSFTTDIKNEMIKKPPLKHCCALAEMYGIFLMGRSFEKTNIRIISEFEPLFSRVDKLYEGALIAKSPIVYSTWVTAGKKKIMHIDDKNTMETIQSALGYENEVALSLHLHGWLLEEDCCRSAFLRGMFLCAGFCVSPTKNYHLELVSGHLVLSREIEALLIDTGYPPKTLVRNGRHILYYKESEQIEDYLTFSGAPQSALLIMEAKVEKNLKNKINRQVNCEAANLLKSLDASHIQLEAIKSLQESGRFDSLPESLQQTALLRLSQPDLSIAELAAYNGNITKSGLNYRLNRIIEISKATSTS